MVIAINVGDIYSSIDNPRQHISALSEVRQVCRARPEGYKFMPKFRKGYWDGFISLMPNMSSFPTGLLELVLQRLESKGFHTQLNRINPECPYSAVTADSLHGIELRSYQIDAANIMLEAGRGVAGMATNSGKTEVMAAMIRAMGNSDVLVLTTRKELLYQTADRLHMRLGIEIGKIGDGVWSPKPVTVGMIQTLIRRIPMGMELPNYKALMVDECHHTSSDSVLDVLSKIPSPRRYGFSGTPLKMDQLQDMKLVAYTGPVRYWLSNAYLIAEGYSAVPTVTMVRVDNETEDDMEYADAYKELIVHNTRRNSIIADMAVGMQGVTLIIVNQIAHGRMLETSIPGAVFIHGSDDTTKRQQVLEDMRSASKGVFISSPIFDEGVDVPSVDAIIMAGGGKSHVTLLQRLGRGMRKKDGKNQLVVVDFWDNGNKHLISHSEARYDVYKAEGFRVIK